MTPPIVCHMKDFINPVLGDFDERIVLFYGDRKCKVFFSGALEGGVRHFIESKIIPFLKEKGCYPMGEHVHNVACDEWIRAKGVVSIPILPPTDKKDEDFL